MSKKGILNRTLPSKEFPWLERDLPKGTEVYAFTGHTYGCISSRGVAVSDVLDEGPFYEVPRDAVSWES